MDPTAVASSIPYTAWEQAVFVALFIVMIGVLLVYFTRSQGSWQKFMDDQNAKWQKALKEQNDSWKQWLTEQNARECTSMDKVTESLEKLSGKIDAHDDKVDDRINDAVAILSKTRTRKSG